MNHGRSREARRRRDRGGLETILGMRTRRANDGRTISTCGFMHCPQQRANTCAAKRGGHIDMPKKSCSQRVSHS
ncbi:hypothetical protein RAN3_0043 [plant metagenome]|uniref:Uncharacterized protein n=2 Tax=plant metagenome TaxID=1297885 RepID=A0A484U9N1_9ZZZZ